MDPKYEIRKLENVHKQIAIDFKLRGVTRKELAAKYGYTYVHICHVIKSPLTQNFMNQTLEDPDKCVQEANSVLKMGRLDAANVVVGTMKGTDEEAAHKGRSKRLSAATICLNETSDAAKKDSHQTNIFIQQQVANMSPQERYERIMEAGKVEVDAIDTEWDDLYDSVTLELPERTV